MRSHPAYRLENASFAGTLCRVSLGTLCMIALSKVALAQAIPDAGSILRDIERQQQVRPITPAPHAVPAAPQAKAADEVRFVVRSFRLTGVTLLGEAEVQAVLAPWIGKEIGFSDLESALHALTELYQRHGWFARPQLPVQDIGDDGTVLINVIEGRLGAIRLDGESSSSLKLDRVLRTMTARQQSGDPLDLAAMDRSINLLNDIPGVSVKATLAPSDTAGASDVVVKVDDKGLAAGTVSIDNTGSRSTGAERLNGNISFDNPSGNGDQIIASVAASEGMSYARFGYSLPIGYDGVRIGANASRLSYHLIGSFASLKSSGTAETQGITASYPLIRKSTGTVNLTLSFDNKRYLNEANGTISSKKSLQVTTVGLGGDFQDGWGNGGMTLWNLYVAEGRLDLSGNAANQTVDQNGPRTEGHYTKLAGTISRLQRLSDTSALWLSLSGQQAFKNLDSSEQFTLGGSQGVRAYPTAEGSGDSGWLATVEARHSLSADRLLAVFHDYGAVTTRHDDSYVKPGGPPNNYALKGVGASLSYTQPSKYSLRLTLSRRLGSNPAANTTTRDDSDGTYKLDRVWLSGIAYF